MITPKPDPAAREASMANMKKILAGLAPGSGDVPAASTAPPDGGAHAVATVTRWIASVSPAELRARSKANMRDQVRRMGGKS